MSATGSAQRSSKDDEDDNFFEDYACFMSTSPEQLTESKEEEKSERVSGQEGEAGHGHVSAEVASVLCEIDEVLNDDTDEEKVIEESEQSKEKEGGEDEDLDDDSLLLYDTDEEEDMAVDMENFAADLDESILYTNDDDLGNSRYFLKKSPSATATSDATSNTATSTTESSTEVENNSKLVSEDHSISAKAKEPILPLPVSTSAPVVPTSSSSTAQQAEPGFNFKEKASMIKQRYYERALRKWKNTTNFADGFMIPPLKDVKAPRLWQDSKTKKYFGGEDPQEWADNNHPMWEEWRRAESFPTFVHKMWGEKNCIDVSRNLSRISATKRTTVKPETNSDQVSKSVPKKSSNQVDEDVSGHLIDEREVLGVLFAQVEDKTGDDDGDDDDEMDNIYSKLEVRPDRKSNAIDAAALEVVAVGNQPCRYCDRVCFCSPAANSTLFKAEEVKRLAFGSLSQLCSEKLATVQSGGNEMATIKRHYTHRAQQVTASIDEMFELGEKVGGGKDVSLSAAQVQELLAVESMQDHFQNYYSSPYEREDRHGQAQAASRTRNQNSSNGFMSQSFLENY